MGFAPVQEVDLTVPPWVERVLDRLMIWHDVADEQRRADRYEEIRVRAIATRTRLESVVASYRTESEITAQKRANSHAAGDKGSGARR